MKVIVLGSGTSTGVPQIGGGWGACDPSNPRNRRTRVSIVIENDAGTRILIDTSPDLRAQLLANDIDRIDAVFWTHDHADHCHGIDDLRPLRFGRNGPIPGYAGTDCAQRLRQRFGYVFAGQHGYPTIVELIALDRLRLVLGYSFQSVQMPHGAMQSTGFRFECDGKSVGYATDFDHVTNEMLRCFDGVDLLVSDCLRRNPHPSHAHLGMALDFARDTGARRTLLTHLDKSMDYAELAAEVPEDVMVAYDGLVVGA